MTSNRYRRPLLAACCLVMVHHAAADTTTSSNSLERVSSDATHDLLQRSLKSACFVDDDGYCSGGCYLYNEEKCLPVGLGHYSPVGSNDRIECPVGSVSAKHLAIKCEPCPPDTKSLFPGQAHCLDQHSLETYVKPILWHSRQAHKHMQHYATHLNDNSNHNVDTMQHHTAQAKHHMSKAEQLLQQYREAERGKMKRFLDLYHQDMEALLEKVKQERTE